MLILSLVYYLAPCLAFPERIGDWIYDVPSASLGFPLLSPFRLGIRQGECTIPGGLACPEDPTTCCASGYQCCGDPTTGCCPTASNCFPLQNGTLACCPTDAQTCDGTTCCKPGGVCCSTSPVGCCPPDSVCCQSTTMPCCSLGSTCCGDNCCDGSQICVSGVCQSPSPTTSPSSGGLTTTNPGGVTSLADNAPTTTPKSGAISSKLASIWAVVVAFGSVWVVGYI